MIANLLCYRADGIVGLDAQITNGPSVLKYKFGTFVMTDCQTNGLSNYPCFLSFHQWASKKLFDRVALVTRTRFPKQEFPHEPDV